jgi:hypothetical protein
VRVLQHLLDLLQDRFHIRNDFMIPKPQHPITFLLQKYRSLSVSFGLKCMLTPIKFDNQTALWTTEIHNESTNGVLPSELFTAEASIA